METHTSPEALCFRARGGERRAVWPLAITTQYSTLYYVVISFLHRTFIRERFGTGAYTSAQSRPLSGSAPRAICVPLCEAEAERASLRARFARFIGKANRGPFQCFSAGTTRLGNVLLSYRYSIRYKKISRYYG